MPVVEFSEEFVIWLWENKHFNWFRLETETAEKCRLIFRGTRNHDSGPDYANTVIEIGDTLLSGNVEIHCHASDWYSHQHHSDRAYNHVILHVVMDNNAASTESVREDGVQVPILALEHFLARPLPELLTEYEQRDNETSTVCRQSQKSIEQRIQLLNQAGASRLTLKALAFREQRTLQSWNQILYSGIMDALGYSKNQVPFRKLAVNLPWNFIQQEIRFINDNKLKKQRIEGLIFGAAGFLPFSTRIPEPYVENYLVPLKNIWSECQHRLGIQALYEDEWLFFRLRPQNFPTRRLAGMCTLLERFSPNGIFLEFQQTFYQFSKKVDTIRRELEKKLIVEAEGFWQDHYRFESNNNPLPAKKSRLIGRERARAIILNIILPAFLVCALEQNDGRLETTVKEVFYQFPAAPQNRVTREMIERLFPDQSQSGRLINSAQKQQGLIHLFKNFCRPQKCADCQQF
ncbi:DUF2851 family protein [bacterium]|nr:DUF2851 family protein [bacterium]